MHEFTPEEDRFTDLLAEPGELAKRRQPPVVKSQSRGCNETSTTSDDMRGVAACAPGAVSGDGRDEL
eukprot:3258958-Pyramimonas_sp.AAC.1